MTDSGNNKQRAVAVQIARGVLGFLGVFWLLLGVLTAGGQGSFQTGAALLWGALMVANGGVMLWLGMRLGSLGRGVFWLSLIFLAINILLTVTDEFGALDLLVLILAVLVVVLLVLSRGAFSRN